MNTLDEKNNAPQVSAPSPAPLPTPEAGSPAERPAPPPEYPKTWLVESLVMIYICLPFGLIALYHAAKVDDLFSTGNYEAARLRARKARFWVQWGLVCAVVLAGLLLAAILVNWDSYAESL